MKYITLVIVLLLFVGCAHVSGPPLTGENEKLLGPWSGKLVTPNGSLTVVFRFETNEAGEFLGFTDSPDQGGYGIPVSSTGIEDGEVTIKVSRLQARYKGKIAGDEMVGEFTQMGRSFPLTLRKGMYKAPAYPLSLSKEAMDQLQGEWQGKIGPLTMVFRFEKGKKGDFKGYVDCPEQGAKGIPITEAALTDGRLELKIKAASSEYAGLLSGNSLSGEYKHPGGSNTLTLTKE